MPPNASDKSGIDNLGADIAEDVAAVDKDEDIPYADGSEKSAKEFGDDAPASDEQKETAKDEEAKVAAGKGIRRKQFETLVIAAAWFFGLVSVSMTKGEG